MADNNTPVEQNRQLLKDAQASGPVATLGAFVRLSGPGWLQSAITLGGGSLAGALFLGILGGPSLLWLQLVAIVMGVVMLSAISYVTLSTGERPFGMINRHINPVLGWGWLVATSLANMIWCMPQFGLCYEALEQNLMPGVVGDSREAKLGISLALLAVTFGVLMLNLRGGAAAKFFDWFLKALIGAIVLCFFGVVIFLSAKGLLDWSAILLGFVPDFSQWAQPAGNLKPLIEGMTDEARQFWEYRVVREQRAIMIGAAATAVGINMTFLMPYSLLQRGWDRTFRGLARFDLATGMAIPYILVTACVVIAAAQAFHSQADEAFLSNDPTEVATSPLFADASGNLMARVSPDLAGQKFGELAEEDKQALASAVAELPESERLVAASLVRRNAFKLSKALEPLLGEKNANLVFGLGIFGMGFSTIIILMMINGFVFCEAAGCSHEGKLLIVGSLVAGIVGAMWPYVWDGPAKLWLAILASTFGIMLLPIAYVTFFMLMNSKSVLGEDRPRGASRFIWNLLMGVSVIGAFIAAITAIFDKVTDVGNPTAALAGRVVVGLCVVYLIAVALGFFMRKRETGTST